MNDEELHDFIYGRRPDISLMIVLCLLPISHKDKKYAWSAYCKASGKTITRQDILQLTGGAPI